MNSDLKPSLDQIGPVPPPSLDDLQAIIGRARLRTRRMVSIGTVVALAAAAITITEWPTSRVTTRVASSSLGPAALAVAVSSTPASTSGPTPPIVFSPLFIRTTNDEITIRAHFGTITGPLPCPPNQVCPTNLPHTLVHVGLSTDSVVGEMAVPADGPPPPVLGLAGASGFGLPGVVSGFALIFRTGAPVARVRMSFADGGHDEMAPVNGWVVVAHLGQAPLGTVEAQDSSGRILGSTSIPPAASSAGVTPGNAQAPPAPAHQTEV